MVTTELSTRLNEAVSHLNRIESDTLKAKGYTLPPDVIRWSERAKYCAIDFGTSGAFLVEKATGEIFNIKAYGSPDRNKKRKADIGNIFPVIQPCCIRSAGTTCGSLALAPSPPQTERA